MIHFRGVILNPFFGGRRGYTLLILILSFMLLAACRDAPSAAPAQEEVASSPVGVTSDDVAPTATPLPVTEEPEKEVDSAKEGNDDSGAETLEKEAPEETATPLPSKEIVVCMSSMPVTIFPYGDRTLPAEALRHAIYETPFINGGYEYQAQGLEKLPSLTDGDASIEIVKVTEGERVVDSSGNIVSLLEDVTVINSDGEEVTFDGEALKMEQMVVDFTLKPMSWSDGKPVTAEDSVFSYELASSAESAYRSSAIAHTADYEATGDLMLRWTGLPGYLDQTYFTNIWPPLPSHQELDIITAPLEQEGLSKENRLSSGPFVISERREDGTLILDRNPHYYRQDQGFPTLDRIVVRFGNGEDFLAGEQVEPCDVITSDALSAGILPILEFAVEMDDWEVQTVPGNVFENIAFGVNPVNEYAERRPDWFEDLRVRQAMTMCTDRQRMVDELTDGYGQVVHAYVGSDHPLYPDNLEEWPYDPIKGNALLDEAGYLDFAEDGRRQDISSGVPMTITLGTNSESTLRLKITQIMQENMADCGIPVETYELPAGTWYAPGPQGRLFGRRFDLASFAWLTQISPSCGLYAGSNITGPEEAGFGGWQNLNVTGWSDEDFDEACSMALTTLPGREGYEEFQQEALRIFAQELPAIPLFTNVKIAAVKSRVREAELDSSQRSMLWNIYEWDVDE